MSNLLAIWKEWPWAFAKDKGLVSFGNAFLCAIARPCPLLNHVCPTLLSMTFGHFVREIFLVVVVIC